MYNVYMELIIHPLSIITNAPAYGSFLILMGLRTKPKQYQNTNNVDLISQNMEELLWSWNELEM